MAGPLSGAPAHLCDLRMEDGAVLRIRRGGKPGGVRLFISHGNGFAVDGYRVFWEPLLADFDVILFDMRNHGQNAPTGADGHHYAQMARDLGSVRRGVTEKLGPAKSVGVFHSMSARAAMKQAVQMEWVWDALVLYDPPNVPLSGHPLYEAMRAFEVKLMEWALARQERFSSPDALAAQWAEARAQSRWQPQARADMAAAVLRPESGDYVLSCDRALEASIYLAALTMNLWPSASAYGGPVKLIGCDPAAANVPPTGAANRALAEEGGYEYEAISETGHLLQIERPAPCRAALLSFLAKHALA
jgi:pimeloyl-ACP methyl ester carboxylesterase